MWIKFGIHGDKSKQEKRCHTVDVSKNLTNSFLECHLNQPFNI